MTSNRSRNTGGRPHLDGKPAGQGAYTKTYCITLPPETADRLRAIGGGNLSKGVRIAEDHYSSEFFVPMPTNSERIEEMKCARCDKKLEKREDYHICYNCKKTICDRCATDGSFCGKCD